MLSVTGLVASVPRLGEGPSECCVGSHFFLFYSFFVLFHSFVITLFFCNGCLQCVTAFAWAVVIYCVAQFCNSGSLNRTLHVPTYIISLTWYSIIILYQLANDCIKHRFYGVYCFFSVPFTCFRPSFLFILCQLKLYCTDASRLIHCIRSCMNYCNNQKYNEV